jgi:DNA polymerase
MKICNLDFETGSEIDLTEVGVYNYARHPSTRAWVLRYTFNAARKVHTWHIARGEKMPADLDAALDDPEVMFEGWNVSFERLIFRDVLNIDIPIRRFRCTMARARAMALPGGLGLCGKALQVDVPKAEDFTMRRWMRPLKDHGWLHPDRDVAEYDELCWYCGIDVVTEVEIGGRLRDLTPEEWEDYWICEAMNDRGLPVDIDLAVAAQRYAEAELKDIKQTLAFMTKDSPHKVTSPKQFQRIKDWLQENLPPDMQLEPDDKGKITFDRAVRDELLSIDNQDFITGEVREFIQLIHDGGRASTAKFSAMQARAGADGRVRGAYVFNGAGQTHRFSSHGLQVHNFVRRKLSHIDVVVDAIIDGVAPENLINLASYRNGALVTEPGESEPIARPYDIMTILSRCLRPAIMAPEGRQLVWGDWEQIEARVLPWLSGQNSASELLDVFARGEDVYRRQAALTYNIDQAEVTKTQRQNGGKIPVLAFGFGGGEGAIMSMARAYGVRLAAGEAEELKVRWRATNPWARSFWQNLEVAAYNAVNHPGQEEPAGRVVYYCDKDVLWCMLPSGRMLAYPFPRLEEIEGRFGPQVVVTCMKGSWHPKKNQKQWPRMKLWGGIQAENVTQAEALSLLRYGARELHRNGWPLVGHTHDELLLEVADGEVDEACEVLHDVMVNAPPCFAGLPLAAEVMHGQVYGK